MDSIATAILGFILRIAFWILFWFALFPVVAVLATPFILALAIGEAPSYFDAVLFRYRQLWEWWFESIPWL